ncbi:hypothetical protein JAG45_000141 [Providencia rettgeri]|uniref:hypothetical protein n=1 Tax=Providencia rettgeri TaxID=587 RepID=UPI001CFB77F5|nr:hypothetical protein [Providencia rettgeri]EHZ7764284.1 hypothetical protein [Providencia rettgeri]EIJ7167426.1 hypothetical protein [Providencia rettgeri]ELR5089292.1 hypothetical protein [Providencia rettgeri]MCB4812648.1 hypothetical protein [Providencia rettgeri]MCJ2285414.1 hypothetical protein [Providencia rettgeri]
MTLNDKLNEMLHVEKIKMAVPQNINWLSVERILKHRKLEKYSLWIMTGKILPEAGQISPAIAHSGHTLII